ncbi:chorismate--pyruvate lyase family protein [Zooshikella ganghwensis]|uniref:chorismate--pyruvate lyase family protein n=1 Tax=Zooshikella ganghwensis TaxID=202772 RepID=UPI000409F1A1|nr:chorismate lyase [Zooshikella ganghwensis]
MNLNRYSNMQFFSEHCWQPTHKWPAHDPLCPHLKHWLTHPGSLTEQLAKHFNSKVSVHLHRQQWLTATKEEQQYLVITPDTLTNIREITLFVRQQPCILARTVIPKETLSGNYQDLLTIKEQPLGHFLFGNANIIRLPQFELTTLKTADLPIQHDLPLPSEQVWGRRSRFLLSQKPLMITEYFLPFLLHSIENEQIGKPAASDILTTSSPSNDH